MIDLGLSRISRLLQVLGNPHLSWKAVHVAGTNGKGSICAYVASCLNEKWSTGRFTSPHLVDRWDCVWVNGATIAKDTFIRVEGLVKRQNEQERIGATEFEILTATAFEIFRQERVDMAVIEVGLGGRLDSTNILPKETVLASVIAKVGMDHESFLGSTLDAIGREKAGIIKESVPCVVDQSNDSEVLKAVEEIANERDAPLIKASELPYEVHTPLKGAYQQANLSCALNVLKLLEVDEESVRRGVAKVEWPGRLQWIEHDGKRVLLDGAHNPQSAVLLRQFIDNEVDKPHHFVMAFSQGKDVESILKELVRPTDHVLVTGFGSVDSMPWVKSQPVDDLAAIVRKYTNNVEVCEDNSKCLDKIPSNSITCGSLYLVADVLRRCRRAPDL